VSAFVANGAGAGEVSGEEGIFVVKKLAASAGADHRHWTACKFSNAYSLTHPTSFNTGIQ